MPSSSIWLSAAASRRPSRGPARVQSHHPYSGIGCIKTLHADEKKVRPLELLPEHHMFALFMGLQIYLYLHARLSADLAADVTRIARDDAYRLDVERAVERQTGLVVSFADAADVEPQNGVQFDQASVDWDEIREFAHVAAGMLSKFGDPLQLTARADAFIEETIEEMRKPGANPAASSVAAGSALAAAPAAGIKTIGLCMIVKDEAHVILRCLDSVRPLVDYVLIVDTGSTDGTQRIIADYLAREGLPGAVIDEPWRNFAYNRTFALEELRKVAQIDYALIIDADDQLELDDDFDPKAFKAALSHDLYDVAIAHGNMRHFRPHLFRNDLPFSFKGVVHEYLEAPPGGLARDSATGFHIKIEGGGARSRNTRKFQDDAALLERALATEADPFLISRYTFYLAQSYKDAGEKEKALENYLKRAELGYWAEEIYIGLLEAGNMMAALDRPFDEVVATYLRAADLVPTRAEALHAVSHYCRDHGKNAEGYEYARRGIDLTLPAGALFAQPWVYDYGLLDEYGVNAYWAGLYRESLDACLRLLASDKLPASMHARIVANARFAFDKLPKPADLGALGKDDAAEVDRDAEDASRRAIGKASSGDNATKRRVVWHRPGAIGDVLMTLNFVKLYKKENPDDWVIYRAAPSIADMLGPVMLEAGVDEVATTADEVACDKQFNLIGYPLGEGYPEKPMARHLVEYFSEELGLGGRREDLQLNLPKRTIDPPYITLHPHAGWSMYKNWPLDRWAWVCRELKKRGIPVVQIGGPGDQAVEGVEFSRLGLPFSESLGLLANAALHVGIDSWSNHATNIVWQGKGKVPGVILWGSTQASAAGYQQNHNISLGLPCQPCFREDPKISGVPRGVCPNPAGQTYEKPLHACMHGISREHVLEAIVEEYARSSPTLLSPACAAPSSASSTANYSDGVSAAKDQAAAEVSPAARSGAPPIHLINLDRSTDRLAAFHQRNGHLHDVVRLAAVDGRSTDKGKLIDDGVVTDNLEYSDGALGCAMSHISLWKLAVSKNLPITVAEDDALFANHFAARSTTLLAGLADDWDIVMWGFSFAQKVWVDALPGVTLMQMEFYQGRLRQNIDNFQALDTTPTLLKLGHLFGTVCYTVSPKGARALLEYCLPLRPDLIDFPGFGIRINNEGIDCMMNGAYPSLQAFVCAPPLVVMDSRLEESTIRRKYA